MDIARPKAGFILREPPSFKTILDSAAKRWPRVHSHWDGIKERLKITAHREGARAAGAGDRVFEAQGDADSGLPTVRVAYRVLGDTVTFVKLDIIDPASVVL
jgi:hypothetical protein